LVYNNLIKRRKINGSFIRSRRKLLLDWLMTTGSATRPTAWYVGLFTAAPSDSGGGTEVSGKVMLVKQ
jgi:hypothetical protein